MYARFITFIHTPVSPPLLNHAYSKQVEQYRGLCAILVLLAHGFAEEGMLIDKFKWPEFTHYISAGYLSVMVFFCISGYVIGITNDTKKLDIKTYLQKRATRLYPIYLVSIFLCVIIAGGVSLWVLLGNLLFLQNGLPYFNIRIPLFVNFPTWSLNYEVVYYLLFLLIFYLQPKVWKILLLMLILSIVLIHSTESIRFFVNYVNGFYFWMAGLLIGWSIFKTSAPKDKTVPLLSILFLHMCIHHLSIGKIILNTVGIQSGTNIIWLFDLPFCFMVMCILTGKDNAFIRLNKIVSYALPGCIFLYLILHHRLTEDVRWIMCLLFWVLSFVFYFEKKVSAFLMEKLTPIGKISYALYLLHVPVAMLIKKTVFIHDLKMEATVKYFLWISITFTLSFILERIFQPAIRKYFLAR